MAQLKGIKLAASTLIEVIVAMVILLVVFAIGMMIYANLNKNSSTTESFQLRKQLKSLQQAYVRNEIAQNSIVFDSIEYFIETEQLETFTDRIKLKIYAIRMGNNKLLDSLISIQEVNTAQQQDTE
ncbi:type II secretion system protein [Sphingobacterium cavernae]|uniref:type II secretion system protein n=1 Tax=Sphingobacterium cavernae TaxID=2592657 RepID=UPI00122FFECA|nr:hypothetical protein [Sphingobacterium cavernae]